MSSATVAKRHALGLPAGSIRAAHVLGVVGLVCGLLLVPPSKNVHVPPYLLYLLFLVLGHYFAAHGGNIQVRGTGAATPLYLPGGTVRILILLMLGGTLGWLFYSSPEGLRQQFESSLDEVKRQPIMPLVILGGFFLGVVIRGMMGRDNPPQGWQDFEAWVSIMALVGLLAASIIHLVIGASVAERLSMPMAEGILGGVVAFYFGARS